MTEASSSASQTYEGCQTLFSDFALVVSGTQLKCHKVILAKNSDFFEALLRNEGDVDTMEVTGGFSLDTVKSFLEYLYSKVEWMPESEAPKRQFDKNKLTPELLRLADMYQAQTLKAACVAHLEKSLTDENVVDVWVIAERCGGLEELRKQALYYIVKKRDGMTSLPGMEDIVGTSACPELKSLIAFMGTRLDGKKILTESPDMITIHVKSYTGEFKCAPDCCYTFNIASSQTAKDLREKVATVVGRDPSEFTILDKDYDLLDFRHKNLLVWQKDNFRCLNEHH